ncbi:Hypothetical protein R9X50_00248300 [Acrodontium crateriforme]|uniref:VPS37 C-terminal domain-containing protein n=1 Tax=Acrodontium crateriforme TaxID=150365 RepID=A0AAQ3M188_9PEZI|nr:Hypothetical protein R9X50_00248300 [Acrodontium crateriforme]
MSFMNSPAHIAPSQPSPYSATPPAPPPKPSTSSTPQTAPPRPPPPPGQAPNEPHELDGSDNTKILYQSPHHAEAPHIPAIEPSWVPEALKEKTTTDLHALLQDQSLLSAILDNPESTHPAVKASQATLQPLVGSNLVLAASLSQLEAQLTHQRTQTQSRLLALRALEQQHRGKLAETEKALQAFSPMALYQRLNASVQEQDALIKGLEESWLEESGLVGEREVNDFLRRVRDGKKTAFLRKERKERWDEGRVGGWR